MRAVNFFGTILKPSINKRDKTVLLIGTNEKADKKGSYLSMSDIKKGYRDYEVKIKV